MSDFICMTPTITIPAIIQFLNCGTVNFKQSINLILQILILFVIIMLAFFYLLYSMYGKKNQKKKISSRINKIKAEDIQ